MNTNKDRTDPVWEGIETQDYPSLNRDIKTDICIVGGGITGLSIAYQLAKRGRKVTLVEAFKIGSGQTSRTTAHLTCQLEETFTNLLKTHDQDTVSVFLEAHRRAIDVIEEIVTNENISCDFKRVDGYLFQGEDGDSDSLINEQEAGRKCGINLDYLEVTPLLSNSQPSLRFPRQAQFNPLKYIKGLLRVLGELDVEIYEGTHIKDFRQDNRKDWVLLTDRNDRIETNYLIVATNTPVNNRFYIHTKQSAYRTYAMSFKITNPVKDECLLWDTEDPYHYVRFVEDTLVVGGEDHKTGQQPLHDPFTSLENWARKKFPFIKEVTSRWSGQVFEPMDQIGFIGKNPGLENNCFISTGESGIGMTSSAIASLIISDLITKGDHPWAKVFDPSRPMTHAISEFIHENANIAFQYKDWILEGKGTAVQDIPVDSGAVMSEGLLTKSCVYHEDGNHFEKKSAICTHLGGIVHWNDIEKTWDCPCHGSRFNTKGTVIEGPAVSDLSEQ